MSFITHNKSKTSEYYIWHGIRQRCNNKKCNNYHRYGARGIKICKRWDESFESFLSDMGMRPSSRHSIDRIDNNGDYKPSNCKWATKKEQERNKRSNSFITYKRETLCLKDMADKYNISEMLLWQRINRLKWSVKKAIEHPKNKFWVYITYNGETLCMEHMANKYNISPLLLWSRIKRQNWSVKKAIEHPIQKQNG